jgi:hypothetical protein
MSATVRSVRPPLRVGVVLAHQFTRSPAVFIDHLRLAADEVIAAARCVQWSIMSSRTDSVAASCGVLIEPIAHCAPRASTIVVIGGLLHAGPQIDEATALYLREADAADTPDRHLHGQLHTVPHGPHEGPPLMRELVPLPGFPEAFPNQEVIADRLFLVDGHASPAPAAPVLPPRHLPDRAASGACRGPEGSQVLLFDRPRSAVTRSRIPRCPRL